jgi:cytidine deaminase
MTDIHVTVWDEAGGEGTPAVFVHDILTWGSDEAYGFAARAPLADRYRLLLVDRRGYGRSPGTDRSDFDTDAGPDEDGIHPMGAAVMAADYRMSAGVNLYHFTGGPCAELVALGAARAQGARQMRCIVAVGNHGRGVIGPCGRDRQVFLDYYPTMRVIVPTPEGLRSVLAADLVPPAQQWTPEPGMNGLDPSLCQDPETAGPPIIRFDPRYLDVVRSGAKSTTTRFRDTAQLGPVRLVFESDPEVVLSAEVTGIRHCLVSELTDQGAQAEGLTAAAELREALKGHYPDLAATDEVDVITFRIDDKTGAA